MKPNLLKPTRLRQKRPNHGSSKCCKIVSLPIVLYEQFKLSFNLYLLLVTLSQPVPALKVRLRSCLSFSSHDLTVINIAGFIVTYIAPPAFATIGRVAYDIYGTRKTIPPGIPPPTHHISGVDTTSPLNGGPHNIHLALFYSRWWLRSVSWMERRTGSSEMLCSYARSCTLTEICWV